MSLLASRFFSSLDRVLSVIPLTSLAICLKRLGPADRENRISSFHLPSSASRASRMDSMILGQLPLVSIVCFFVVLSHWKALSKEKGLSVRSEEHKSETPVTNA